MTTELTERILKHLEGVDKVDTFDLVAIFNEDHQKIVGALKSIEAHGNLVNSEVATHKSWELTEEGKFVAQNGSHEAAVFNAIPKDGAGISQADLMKVSKKLCHLNIQYFYPKYVSHVHKIKLMMQ